MLNKERNEEIESKLPVNLEQIITAQIDEPDQKMCVFKVEMKVREPSDPQIVKKVTQIRVKSINFLEQSAIAIFFYDITRQLEVQDPEKDSKVQSQEHTAMTKELRTSLSVSLQFLESILGLALCDQA